jgi:O-antigen/teichoic acid export membrane protein
MHWILNIASSYLRFAISMVVVLMMTPYIIDQLGMEMFGLWSLIFAVIGIFGLMDFGFATAAVKAVAEATGSNDATGRNRALASLLVVYTLIGLISLVLVFTLGGPVADGFDLTDSEHNAFLPVFWLLGLAVSLNFPASLFKAALSGAGRMHIVNAVELLMVLVNAGLIYTLLQAGYGITGLAISTAATMLGTSLALIPLAYRLLPGFSLHWRLASLHNIRPLLSFSVYAFMANIAVLTTLRLDLVVIKLFLPLSAVALYAVAAKISEYTFLLNKQFSNALMPLVSQLHGRGDSSAVRRIMTDGTRLLLALAVPAIGLLYFYAPELIHLWLGAEFADSAGLLRILLLALVPMTLQLNAANILGMTGQHRFLAIAMLVSAALNLLLTVLLISLFGIHGAALGTLAAVLLVEAAVILPRACRHSNVSAASFLGSVVWPTLPAALPMLAVAFALDQWLATDSFALLCFKVATCGIVYLVGFYFTGLSAAERGLLADKLLRTAPAVQLESK